MSEHVYSSQKLDKSCSFSVLSDLLFGSITVISFSFLFTHCHPCCILSTIPLETNIYDMILLKGIQRLPKCTGLTYIFSCYTLMNAKTLVYLCVCLCLC